VPGKFLSICNASSSSKNNFPAATFDEGHGIRLPTTVRELVTLYRMARAMSPPGEKGIIVISRFFTNLPKDIGCLLRELGLR
jgi:hypothetical protein